MTTGAYQTGGGKIEAEKNQLRSWDLYCRGCIAQDCLFRDGESTVKRSYRACVIQLQ